TRSAFCRVGVLAHRFASPLRKHWWASTPTLQDASPTVSLHHFASKWWASTPTLQNAVRFTTSQASVGEYTRVHPPYGMSVLFLYFCSTIKLLFCASRGKIPATLERNRMNPQRPNTKFGLQRRTFLKAGPLAGLLSMA